MDQERCWVIDYLVFYLILVTLLMGNLIHLDGFYFSSFVLIALLIMLHVILRVSVCFCIYSKCTACIQARRERIRLRREEKSARVREVLERAKEAYLEHMTND